MSRFAWVGSFGALAAIATQACGDGDGGEFRAAEDASTTSDANTAGSGGESPSGGAGGASGGTGAAAGTGGVAGMGGTAGTGGAGGDPDAGAADAAPDAPSCFDDDFDGFTTCDGDCDDNDSASYPGGSEICGDEADNDCDGTADQDAVCAGLGTFVSVKTGKDGNPGTRSLPVRTIAEGIDHGKTIVASTGRPVQVFVAEGTYPEHVALTEWVSLLGGFECSAPAQPPPTPPPSDAGAEGGVVTPPADAGPMALCEWTRDPSSFVSVIENRDFNGVTVDDSVTRATRLDGFEIRGKSGDAASNQIPIPTGPANALVPGSIAVQLNGGSPEIQNNTIIAGDVTGGGGWPPRASRSIAIAILPFANDVRGPRIERNTIFAGSSQNDQSIAIAMEAVVNGAKTPVFATIVGNPTIRAGSGTASAAITTWNAGGGTLVRNNDIFAGTATSGGSWGIVGNGQLDIEGNRINTDTASPPTCQNANSWCGGINSESMTATITNNVVFGADSGKSAAVHLSEFETPRGAIVLNGNYLHGAGANSSISTALLLRSGPALLSGTVARMGRVRNNILVGGLATDTYGVFEDDIFYNGTNPGPKEHHPLAFTHNDIFLPQASLGGGTHLPYRRWDGTAGVPVADITAVNALGAVIGVPFVRNIDADCKFDASTQMLLAGSACIDVGTGMDAPATDHHGTPRPQGPEVDIGPHEVAP